MDRIRTCFVVLAVGAMLGIGLVPAEAANQFGVSVFGGFQTYSMEDVNDDIQAANAFLGTNFDEVSDGAGYGAGLRMRTSGPVTFSLDYMRLTGSTSDSGDDGIIAYDIDYDLPANAIVLGATYLFPSESRARFGLSGGIGYYMADASLHAMVSDGSTTEVLDAEGSGNGVGFHGAGTVDVLLSPVVHLEASLGYRVAKSGDLEVDYPDGTGETWQDYQVDWSGLMSKVGFSFYFGSN